MARKYRIVKKEVTNGIGEITSTIYLIQFKLLWFWVNATIRCGYTLCDKNIICIDKRVVEFDSYNMAKEAMNKYLINPFKEYYNGCKIINAYIGNGVELFVNKSYVKEVVTGTYYYECSLSLDHLKGKINKRIINIHYEAIK